MTTKRDECLCGEPLRQGQHHVDCPARRDEWDEKAAKLLPCQFPKADYPHKNLAYCNQPGLSECDHCLTRPAVAAALRGLARERDKALAEVSAVRRLLSKNTSQSYWRERNELVDKLAAAEALLGAVSHIGLLDHERMGVLECSSCRVDARMIRNELEKYARLGGACCSKP